MASRMFLKITWRHFQICRRTGAVLDADDQGVGVRSGPALSVSAARSGFRGIKAVATRPRGGATQSRGRRHPRRAVLGRIRGYTGYCVSADFRRLDCATRRKAISAAILISRRALLSRGLRAAAVAAMRVRQRLSFAAGSASSTSGSVRT